jgi:hypothetical protein
MNLLGGCSVPPILAVLFTLSRLPSCHPPTPSALSHNPSLDGRVKDFSRTGAAD